MSMTEHIKSYNNVILSIGKIMQIQTKEFRKTIYSA